MTFCQNVKTALARTAQTGTDGNRMEMREPRAPREMQDESRKLVSATFCRTPQNAVRPEPASHVSPARGMVCKRTNGGCTRTDSIQNGKSLPKPCFSPLFAPAGSTLRQKSFVFAEGGSFLCGKRFCFYREKTTVGTEKCSIQTVPLHVFLQSGPLLRRFVLSLKHGSERKAFLSGRKFRAWVTIRHGRCCRFPH